VLLVICAVLIGVLGTEAKKQKDRAQIADGRRARADAAAVDASYRRDLALRRAHLIIESSDVAIIVCDKEGIIIACNAAAEVLLGWDHKEVVGRHSSLFVPEAYRERHIKGLERACKALEEYEGDWRLTSDRRVLTALKKDGTEAEFVASVRAIKYGENIDFILTLTPNAPPKEGPLMLRSPQPLSTIEHGNLLEYSAPRR
jgi:PAS domain S-box-containing protein